MPGEDDSSSLPPVEGQVKVNVMGEEVAIDADAYMAELREEVETLRTELDRVEEARREATQSDLLAYVRSCRSSRWRRSRRRSPTTCSTG